MKISTRICHISHSDNTSILISLKMFVSRKNRKKHACGTHTHTHTHTHIYIYFVCFLVKETSGILFFGPSFRKPARKASSGEIYLKNKDLYDTDL